MGPQWVCGGRRSPTCIGGSPVERRSSYRYVRPLLNNQLVQDQKTNLFIQEANQAPLTGETGIIYHQPKVLQMFFQWLFACGLLFYDVVLPGNTTWSLSSPGMSALYWGRTWIFICPWEELATTIKSSNQSFNLSIYPSIPPFTHHKLKVRVYCKS